MQAGIQEGIQNGGGGEETAMSLPAAISNKSVKVNTHLTTKSN
jgi:hypothetical protein